MSTGKWSRTINQCFIRTPAATSSTFPHIANVNSPAHFTSRWGQPLYCGESITLGATSQKPHTVYLRPQAPTWLNIPHLGKQQITSIGCELQSVMIRSYVHRSQVAEVGIEPTAPLR